MKKGYLMPSTKDLLIEWDGNKSGEGMQMKFRFITLIMVLLSVQAVSGETNRPVITAVRITSPLKLDGNLDEPQWKLAQPAENFKQREPENGAPATERTEVRILYDQNNLYIGVWCDDSQPGKI
ncbi:MAG TPA: hypothetical protein ENH53_12745, partial [Bacteroidetes bacterium]|nr:hypothetical protein [Bacteroidota bacterium]